MKFRILVAVLLLIPLYSHAAETVKLESDALQRIDAKFRLFKTENTWNFIELDSQTGKIWQVQFSVDADGNRIKIPINTESLAKDGKSGRFTLYPTKNMYNFILLDQDNGKTWQVQFATDNNQMIKQIVESKGDFKPEIKSDSKNGKNETSWSQ
jgi:hypothetical protein